ncbi:serine protease [Bacillus toyonensis]|uniref:S1 family peptidase n=1 Tax=Bacillus toyonensis TaxID=155322 RepID=UPI000BF1E0E5|nr:serine protease [Bacillus toyonensis]PEN69785.1 serine protease [Bacillus toyonensis]
MAHNLSTSEQLMYSTVRIECLSSNGQRSTGTGFFFNFLENGDRFVPAIVTNKHVVEGAMKGLFLMTIADENDNPVNTEHVPIELENFEQGWIFHPDPNVDLCVMPIAPVLNRLNDFGKKAFYIALTKDLIPNFEQLSNLRAIEDITMIGYPTGLWDQINNLPIVRKGITATHPNINYNGRDEILIDAACFPGSSGSPVLLFNENGYTTKDGTTHLGATRVLLLGVLYAGPQFTATGEIVVTNVPTSTQPLAVSRIPMNLGMVIKANKLLDFEELLK